MALLEDSLSVKPNVPQAVSSDSMDVDQAGAAVGESEAIGVQGAEQALGVDDSAEAGLHARVRVLLGDVADSTLREALTLLSKAGILAGRGYGRNPYHLSPLYDCCR